MAKKLLKRRNKLTCYIIIININCSILILNLINNQAVDGTRVFGSMNKIKLNNEQINEWKPIKILMNREEEEDDNKNINQVNLKLIDEKFQDDLIDYPSSLSQFKLNEHSRRSTHSVNGHMLPSGPPPFRPPIVLLNLMNSNGNRNSNSLLNKLKTSKTFKNNYISNVYYFYFDVLRQLNILSQKLIEKRLIFSRKKLISIQALINVILNKKGSLIKLKWPLIMLNPKFITNLLRDPTFLVMLFHSIETAYTSMPNKRFILKPLINIVNQPSLEKEERIWWKRKRQYDLINGPNSSELEPNLRAKHFKFRSNLESEELKLNEKIIAKLRKFARKLSKKGQINPTYYRYPLIATQQETSMNSNSNSNKYPNGSNWIRYLEPHEDTEGPQTIDDYEFNNNNDNYYSSIDQITYKDSKPASVVHLESNGEKNAHYDYQTIMSPFEFESLEPKERKLILLEAKRSFEESKLTDELIKQQTELIESFTNNKQNQFYDENINNNNINLDQTYKGSEYEHEDSSNKQETKKTLKYVDKRIGNLQTLS